MRPGRGAQREVQPMRHPSAQAETRSRDTLPSFVNRLVVLGATLDEVEDVKARWDTWDDDNEGGISRRELVRLDDAALQQMLAENRREFVSNNLTEEEEADQQFRSEVTGYLNEAQLQVVNGSVDSVVEWVGDDTARARAVWIAEQTVPDHKARKTLLDALAKDFGFDDAVEG